MTHADEIQISRELEQLEDEIREVKKRLPAHSVKPPVMMELLELEDRRDRLLQTLAEKPGHDVE